ncbi:hypothetical protein M3O96_13605 [Aquiflexum sp. TKW24L]|uniref:hypothetical protein n=1 Tax=Aquiflexum sp. TKW24L TaxID=2942212 RepID=UPI0020BEFBA5|nr:hypothetical protein [Aquiflexum sp. TKW24L]MCL6260132.1 hypothetical protein [Aquiflexum sp. TKW24L]
MFFKTRLYFTAFITLAILFLLLWNHSHGGVPSHHLLAREDLPEIYNWWGAILLPLLTLLLTYRVEKRLTKQNKGNSRMKGIPKSVIVGFFLALLFGITLSAFFSFGNTEIPGYMLMGALVTALFFPIYRAECLLGFVIGMTYTFGAVLPTGIGSILLLVSAVIYLGIRPVIWFVISKARNLADYKAE